MTIGALFSVPYTISLCLYLDSIHLHWRRTHSLLGLAFHALYAKQKIHFLWVNLYIYYFHVIQVAYITKLHPYQTWEYIVTHAVWALDSTKRKAWIWTVAMLDLIW